MFHKYINTIILYNIKKSAILGSIWKCQERLGCRGCKLNEIEKAAHAEKCEEFKRLIGVEGWWRGLQGGVKKDTLKLIEKKYEEKIKRN